MGCGGMTEVAVRRAADALVATGLRDLRATLNVTRRDYTES